MRAIFSALLIATLLALPSMADSEAQLQAGSEAGTQNGSSANRSSTSQAATQSSSHAGRQSSSSAAHRAPGPTNLQAQPSASTARVRHVVTTGNAHKHKHAQSKKKA